MSGITPIQNHLVAGGVTEYHYHSERTEKPIAELLGLRTMFLSWFLEQYQVLGGTRDEAIGQVEHIARCWRERLKCIPMDDGERLVPE